MLLRGARREDYAFRPIGQTQQPFQRSFRKQSALCGLLNPRAQSLAFVRARPARVSFEDTVEGARSG